MEFNLGSPPQVRGKPTIFYSAFLPPRITPAGAGKTKDIQPLDKRFWDHPRRCGENGSYRELSH